tara:strand:+ start:6920 stop:7222 length:303 start_codon:yes stop_codon:yes gene_type:complete
MSELLKALNNLPPVKPKKHFVKVDGKNFEVSLQKKLEIMKVGEDNYMVQGQDIVKKPKLKFRTRFSKLKTVKIGYKFHGEDIHWPIETVEGGQAWVIEQE